MESLGVIRTIHSNAVMSEGLHKPYSLQNDQCFLPAVRLKTCSNFGMASGLTSFPLTAGTIFSHARHSLTSPPEGGDRRTQRVLPPSPLFHVRAAGYRMPGTSQRKRSDGRRVSSEVHCNSQFTLPNILTCSVRSGCAGFVWLHSESMLVRDHR